MGRIVCRHGRVGSACSCMPELIVGEKPICSKQHWCCQRLLGTLTSTLARAFVTACVFALLVVLNIVHVVPAAMWTRTTRRPGTSTRCAARCRTRPHCRCSACTASASPPSAHTSTSTCRLRRCRPAAPHSGCLCRSVMQALSLHVLETTCAAGTGQPGGVEFYSGKVLYSSS